MNDYKARLKATKIVANLIINGKAKIITETKKNKVVYKLKFTNK